MAVTWGQYTVNDLFFDYVTSYLSPPDRNSCFPPEYVGVETEKISCDIQPAMDQYVLLKRTRVVNYQGLIRGEPREVFIQILTPGPVRWIKSIFHPRLLFPLFTSVGDDGATGWVVGELCMRLSA